jgi:hypothetical protein
VTHQGISLRAYIIGRTFLQPSNRRLRGPRTDPVSIVKEIHLYVMPLTCVIALVLGPIYMGSPRPPRPPPWVAWGPDAFRCIQIS